MYFETLLLDNLFVFNLQFFLFFICLDSSMPQMASILRYIHNGFDFGEIKEVPANNTFK